MLVQKKKTKQQQQKNRQQQNGTAHFVLISVARHDTEVVQSGDVLGIGEGNEGL